MSKSEKLDLQIKGMITNLGDLSKPPGSLTIAQNFDMPTAGFLPKRRGIIGTELYSGQQVYEFNNNSVHQMFSSLQLQKAIIAHIGNNANLNLAQQLWYVNNGLVSGGATWLNTPDNQPVGATTAIRSRMIQDTKNHFIGGCTPAPIRLESDIPNPSAVTYAGMPRPPGIDWVQQTLPELTPSSAGLEPQYWLAENFAVGYRCTFVATDNEGKERESAPSGRYIVANNSQYSGWVSGRVAAPITRWQVPFKTNTESVPWAENELKIRLYRSIAINTATSLPNDEMQLCYEGKVTGQNITDGYVTVTDWTPEFALGAYLYTNSVSGGDVSTGLVMSQTVGVGIATENDRPPYCTDTATFANCAFYANTETLMRLSFSIVAVGSGTQVMEVGDSLTFTSHAGSITQTAVAGTPTNEAKFRIYTSSTPSISWSIRRTCENLCASINKNMYSGKFTAVATYIGNDSSPGTVGKIMLECLRQQDDTLLLFTADTPTTALQPYLGVEQGELPGTRDITPNGLAISKPLLLDSVPPSNYTSIAGPDNAIQRIISVSDALFIFLQRGVWIVQGTGPSNFVFKQFDTELRLWNRESVVAYKDHVYAWCYEGIVRISVSGGIERIDLPIRNTVEAIWQYLNPFNEIIPQRGWAVVQPHWNRVLFYWPFFDEDRDNCARALVYHIDTGAWTTYKFWYDIGAQNNGWNCGVVRPIDSFSFFGYKSATYVRNRMGLMQNSSNDAYNTNDMGQSGALYPIESVISWNTCTPNPGQLTGWTDFEFFVQPYLYADPVFNGNPSGAAYPVSNPGAYAVDIISDMNQDTLSQVVLYTNDKGRCIVGQQNGLATRQTVTITNRNGFCAFTGMSFLIRPISNNNTR